MTTLATQVDRSLQPYQIVSQAERLPHQQLITAAQQVYPKLKPHRITVPKAIDSYSSDRSPDDFMRLPTVGYCRANAPATANG